MRAEGYRLSVVAQTRPQPSIRLGHHPQTRPVLLGETSKNQEM
jgi:hypothetical protein